MVYYSKYYVLLWFTTVNTTFYYGLPWWISQFTMVYYSKFTMVYYSKHSVFAEFTMFYHRKYYGLP